MNRRALGQKSAAPSPADTARAVALYQNCYDAMHACDWSTLAKHRAAFLDYFCRGARPNAFLVTALFDDPLLQRMAVDGQNPVRSHCPPRPQHARIRIGYMSADFGDHATSYLFLKTLIAHDKSRFDIYLYDYSPVSGGTTRFDVLNAATHHRSIHTLSDEAAAALIERDEIDILVDMKGQTMGARPHILRFRPAPFIINYLAYPGTNGPSTDYVITDPHTFDSGLSFYEKPLFLPHFYLPYSACSRLPDPQEVAAFKRRWNLESCPLLLGCLNAPYKVTELMVEIWRDALRRHPYARFLIYAATEKAASNLHRAFGAQAEQVIFLDKAPVREHLVRVAALDLFCDTSPVCAHTVALDAAYVGTPLLTLCGKSYVARVAASANRWMQLNELNCTSHATYRDALLRLCEAPPALAALRKRVRENASRLLVDSAADGLEAIYLSLVHGTV